ncbi:MAG: tetratricopeptide repeat protein, partial [Bacteroidales bacterium]|nr:tetratricopeptide repeat protein [Bacteroidales bacterium]
MKKTAITLITGILLVAGALAQTQTQNGVVKTRGRMVGGKLVPGTALAGATVQVDGSQTILAKDGRFSFPVKDGKFIIKAVTKQGYQLVDADACRQYQYSATPLQIVMEEPGKLQADQLATERKLRRELQRRLQQREDEIEEMQLSLDEKNRMLAQINQEREDNEKIIASMSQYYATIDYDQLDSFQQRVTQLLENGELERADSLLRTRGNMTDRIRQMRQEQETEAKEEAELAQQQQFIDQVAEGVKKNIEITATDCQNFINRFNEAHLFDSAARYYDLRAKLDTNNVDWQFNAGYYYYDKIGDYDKAQRYFSKAGFIASVSSDLRIAQMAPMCFDYEGRALMMKGRYQQAAELHQRALNYDIAGESVGRLHVLRCSKNLADNYALSGKYNEAKEQYNEVLKEPKTLFVYEDIVASAYTGLAYVLKTQGKYKDANNYIEKAFQIYEKNDGLDPYGLAMANVVKAMNNKNDEALKCYQKA